MRQGPTPLFCRCPALFGKETVLSSLNCLSALVENSIDPRYMGSFLGSRVYSVDSCLGHGSSVVSFEIRMLSPSDFLFLCKDWLAVLGPLQPHINFKISLSFLDKFEGVKMTSGAHRRLKNKTHKMPRNQSWSRKSEERGRGSPGHGSGRSHWAPWVNSTCSCVVVSHSPVLRSWRGSHTQGVIV